MELLARCRDLALPFYGDLLKSAQPVLRERLFEQAEKGASGAEQRCYYDAIQVLNGCGDAMLQTFSAHLQQGYQQFLAGRDDKVVAVPAPGGNLALVAREQLEDDLAVSMIVSRANSQHAEALWKLNRRLALLRGGRQVIDDNNPFGPARVGEALRAAMAGVDCEQKARIFIYKYLGKLLLAMFGRVFGMLNDTLTQAGVLPNLKFVVSRESDAAVEPSPAPSPAVRAGDQTELLASILEQLHARGQSRTETLSGISYGGLTAGRDGVPGNFLPMDYALALSALQQAPEFSSAAAMLRPLPIEAVEERLFGQLKRQARPEARFQLGQRDADTVDLVGAIFRYMLDDPKLPDVVKSLLSHLHTPYLKLALLDPALLESEEHVARRLLNRMAESGARWVTDEREKVVLPKLKEIVETVLRGFVDDVTLFQRLWEDFLRFREGLDKRSEMAERRNREAQEGMERLTTARQRAAAEIQQRIEGCSIPDTIHQLLDKPWTDFLAFNYLRNGDDSLAWKAALKVVDGVLWSVQGDAGRTREEFQRYRQQLEQSITEGLRTIGYASEAGEELLDALRGAQELAFERRGEASAPPPVAQEPAKPRPAPRAVVTEEPLSEEESAWAARLRDGVEFGTWFEFDRPGQKPVQLKLAWYSKVSAHYMFVNQSGVKQSVETRAALARGLHSGAIRLVAPEKRSFMERALEAILTRLRL